MVVAIVKTMKLARSDADPSVAAFLATKQNKVMPLRRLMNGFATLRPSVHVENLVSSLRIAATVMNARR